MEEEGIVGRSIFLQLWQHLRVEKLPESRRLASRHFSSRKERNRREYPRLKLLPAMNFLLRKIRHRLLAPVPLPLPLPPQRPPRAIFPFPRGPEFLSTSACTRKELIAVRRKLMHPSVLASHTHGMVRCYFELLRNYTNDNL